MERQDYQMLQENDVSRDLNAVNVENQVEMTFTHLQLRKLPDGVSRWRHSENHTSEDPM